MDTMKSKITSKTKMRFKIKCKADTYLVKFKIIGKMNTKRIAKLLTK